MSNSICSTPTSKSGVMAALTSTTGIHVAAEVVVIGAMAYYFSSRCSNLEKEVHTLQERVTNIERFIHSVSTPPQPQAEQRRQPPPRTQPTASQPASQQTPTTPSTIPPTKPQQPALPSPQELSLPEPRLEDECDKILEEEGV